MLQFFHEEGPLREPLRDILCAYAVYRPDLGYVQGMSYLAALLLLNLDTTEEAFIAFSNILYKDRYFTLYRLDVNVMQQHLNLFEDLFQKYAPQVFKKLKDLGIHSDMFLFEWMITIFSRSLPLDISSRIWDSFLYFGQMFIFKTALAIIKAYEDVLLSKESEFEQCLQILNRPKNVR
jgi:TBC1 domain family member 14